MTQCSAVIESVQCDRDTYNSRSLYCAPHYRQRLAGKPFARPVVRRPKGSTSMRDSSGNKQCGRCLDWLPEGDFRSGQKTSDGLHGFCKGCERAWSAAAYHKSGGYKPEMGIFRKFKMRESDYQALLESQGYGCASCGVISDERLSVDHDHSCCSGYTTCGNCTRGLLCRKCNLALGLLDDDPVKLSALFNYLKGWQHG